MIVVKKIALYRAFVKERYIGRHVSMPDQVNSLLSACKYAYLLNQQNYRYLVLS
jgi:hypothetical protein